MNTILKLAAAALLAASTATAPLAAQAPAALPETPAGRAAAEFLETVRGGDSAAVTRFVDERVGDPLRAQLGGRAVPLFARMRGDFGQGRIAEARETADGLELRLVSDRGTFRVTMRVEPAPPHRIVGMRIAGAPPEEGAAGPPPASLDAAARREVVDTLAAALERMYPSADTGRAIGAHLRERERAGAYAALAAPADFARALTEDLRALNGDRHLNVAPMGGGTRRRPGAPGAAGGAEAAPFEPRVLEGNVGYLKLELLGNDSSPARLAAALRALEGTRAVILDLRGVPGGSAGLANLVISHFTPPGVPSLRVENRWEGESYVRETLDEVPGPRRTDVPLYVLVDGGSASAAEDVPFVLQNLGRAVIVGERTAGAGRNNAFVPVGHGLRASISVSRVADPRTGKEWEGIGVKPDLEVPSAEALEAARRHALAR